MQLTFSPWGKSTKQNHCTGTGLEEGGGHRAPAKKKRGLHRIEEITGKK